MQNKLFPDLCHIEPVIEIHDGSRRMQTLPLASRPGWESKFSGSTAESGVWQGLLQARLSSGAEKSATVGVRITFAEWSEEVYVLLPGAVYAGNRFPSFSTKYPPEIPASAAQKNLPLQTEVPRLRYEPGPSCIRQKSSDPAFPGLGFYFPAKQEGLWILTPTTNELGLLGYELEENEARDQATLTIFSPGILREFAYEICCDRIPSQDKARDFAAGDGVTIPLQIHSFPCQEPQGLFDNLVEVRRAMVPPPQIRHDIPFSEVWNILEDKYLRENWVEPQGYFAIGVEPMRSRHYKQNWQIGWTGGMIIPHALFLRGSQQSIDCALRNFDFLFPHGQAASGYFYACGDGDNFYCDNFDSLYLQEHRSLVRKNADALFFMLSTLAAVEARGMGVRIKPGWTDGLRRCADAFVATWDREGDFGQFVNHETGDIVIPGTVSGGLVPAALVLAGRRFATRREEYHRVAIAAAQYFDREFLQRGFTNGGPGDAAQCPDSESLAGLLESFVTLFEETQDNCWLDAALRAATHVASWTVSYDYPFPPQSTFGKLNMLANGTVLANAQNKHSAPGICTHSGLSLLRLYRHTGKSWIMDLLRDIAHTLPQYMSRADRPIPWTIPYNLPDDPEEKTLRPGWMCERVNLTQWGPTENIGEVFFYSCWSEVSLLLTIADLPSIYIKTDTGEVWSLDHIEARLENGVLILENTTAWPATFTILMESAEQARTQPIPSSLSLPVFRAAPGVKISVKLDVA